jgi:hypothetical protein
MIWMKCRRLDLILYIETPIRYKTRLVSTATFVLTQISCKLSKAASPLHNQYAQIQQQLIMVRGLAAGSGAPLGGRLLKLVPKYNIQLKKLASTHPQHPKDTNQMETEATIVTIF